MTARSAGRAGLLALVMALVGLPAGAQTAPTPVDACRELGPGDAVRWDVPTGGRQTGTLVAYHPASDSIVVQIPSRQVARTPGDFPGLEVECPLRNARGTHALTGALVGALAGGIGGAVFTHGFISGDGSTPESGEIVSGAAAGLVAGAAAGVLIGLMIPKSHGWVPWSGADAEASRPAVQIAPSLDGSGTWSVRLRLPLGNR